VSDVYSKRLFSVGGFSDATPVVQYTTPAGVVAVVKCLSFVTGSNASEADAYVLGPGNAKLVWPEQEAPGLTTFTQVYNGHWVLLPGESLLTATSGNSWDIWASGYELSLP
jgi:hypothetical protein